MTEADFRNRILVVETGCWEWQGYRRRDGYGQVRTPAGVPTYAHRLAWELDVGAIPDGMCVLHRCDNRPCVNPAHLFLGTVADNNRDMYEKGRRRSGDRRGERSGHAVLTASQVAEIRKRYVPHVVTARRLSVEFGVSERYIYSLVQRRRWAHVA